MSTTFPTLTDDELLAVVVSAEEAYRPTLLPTVDVDDRDAVIVATLRGQRSLGVRDLMGTDAAGSSPELVRLGEVLRERRPIVSMYVGDEDFNRRTFLLTNMWREIDEATWMRQQVSPVGTHTFQTVTPRDVADDLSEIALKALHDEPTEEGPAPVLCLAFVIDDQTHVLGVRFGHVETTTLDGQGVPGADRMTIDGSKLVDEVRRLVAAVDLGA